MQDWLSAKVLSSTHRSPSSSNLLAKRRPILTWNPSESSRSNGSLFSTMERFVQSVDQMNECILIPCRLMDHKLDAEHDRQIGIHFTGNEIDLYQLFLSLNSIKNDLMWGSKLSSLLPQINQQKKPQSNGFLGQQSPNGLCPVSPVLTPVPSKSQINSSGSQSPGQNGQNQLTLGFGHQRKPSNVSISSQNSVDIPDFNCEDSGVEAELEEVKGQLMGVDSRVPVADSFHFHLNGLQACLLELTFAAEYVTTRYNDELCCVAEF